MPNETATLKHRSQNLLDIIRKANKTKAETDKTELRTLNALVSRPLLKRTFGGNIQHFGSLNAITMDKAFGAHYLLTLLTQSALLKKILYPNNHTHTLYCDRVIFDYFNYHGLFEAGFWDNVNFETAEYVLNAQNVDTDIYNSAVKPHALTLEARLAKKTNAAVFFLDADLLLKKRHDIIMKDAEKKHAAFAHYEAAKGIYYPDLKSLRFPKGFALPQNAKTRLPAVNTSLMFFNDLNLLEQWCNLFISFFTGNLFNTPPDNITAMCHLLAADQRTFPITADLNGYWGTEKIAPFMDIIWKDSRFFNADGTGADWNYPNIEIDQRRKTCLQDIMHTWISKKYTERDFRYSAYQICLMLEIISDVMPSAKKALDSFESLEPYRNLQTKYGCADNMLDAGVVSENLSV